MMRRAAEFCSRLTDEAGQSLIHDDAEANPGHRMCLLLQYVVVLRLREPAS